ncbi:hypothetical protein TeGR_g6167 [Tetraparma gracilis]|uniref:Histone-lysine N-methyltransferase, H3 lysine-79 specific n=1 Tax=Tetraparma gracilis TaxID=2962635 RepID=A0ABQ6MCK2_9STRA|nr:hypothetical protein TeGR_g6167 [Tetraparma gracilis]
MGLFDKQALSDQAKLLVITDFLSRDRIITHNAHSLLKPLILDNDPLVLKLLPLIEASSASDGAEEKDAFIDGIYSLIDSVTEGMFNELFAECGLEVAKHSSKAERADKELTSERSLIYGEVEFRSFTEVLRKICTNVPAGGTFIDIGSGSGKAVMAARMTQDFSTCVGVEIMDGLAALADEIGEKYHSGFRDRLSTRISNECEFLKADFLEVDWSSASVVFANSTCFTDSLMASIADKAKSCDPGAYLVTFTKGINCDDGAFELVEKKRYNMSWGPATVFIHRRADSNGRRTEEEEEEEEEVSDSDEDVSDEEDSDIDSGFYSSSAGGLDEDVTPATSVNSSIDFGAPPSPSTPTQPPRVSTGSPQPLSPGMRRVHAEERLETVTSPKDTMLMHRKRMRGKKMQEAHEKRQQGREGGGDDNLF